jgi:hypothetical protein
MAKWGRPRTAAAIVVSFAVAAGVYAGGGTASAKSRSATPVDPMAAVNRGVRFESTGTQRGAWSWLQDETDTATWEFTGLPSELTDLVMHVRVRVPKGTDSARFYLRFGAGAAGSADEVLGRGVVVLPTSGKQLVKGDIMIPVNRVPVGTDALWMEAGRIDVGGNQPPIDTALGVRKKSLQFAPLRLASTTNPAPVG